MTAQKIILILKPYLLFIPGIIGLLILESSPPQTGNYQYSFQIANVLLILNTLLVVGAQARLVLLFNQAIGRKLSLFALNALLPVVFLTAYLLYVLYAVISRAFTHDPNSIRLTRGNELAISNSIISLLLLHAFITFFFINNQFVARQIKNINPQPQRIEVRDAYLYPMKSLVRTSIFVTIVVMALTIIHDLITLH